jgi:hypothetical protein
MAQQPRMVGYRIVRDQSARIPSILQPVAVDHDCFSPSAKINIVSNAAMHPPLPRWADAVEKVGPLIGINALGIFDPAETGRRFGFTAA